MAHVIGTFEIHNAKHPEGGGYRPPDEEHDYWVDPEGNRVTVSDVLNGASVEQQEWIANVTIDYYAEAYRKAFHKARAEGRIFRGKGAPKHLLLELQRQLPTNHWVPR